MKDSSIHLPILFELVGGNIKTKDRMFRFEHMWLSYKSCQRVIGDS